MKVMSNVLIVIIEVFYISEVVLTKFYDTHLVKGGGGRVYNLVFTNERIIFEYVGNRILVLVICIIFGLVGLPFIIGVICLPGILGAFLLIFLIDGIFIIIAKRKNIVSPEILLSDKRNIDILYSDIKDIYKGKRVYYYFYINDNRYCFRFRKKDIQRLDNFLNRLTETWTAECDKCGNEFEFQKNMISYTNVRCPYCGKEEII